MLVFAACTCQTSRVQNNPPDINNRDASAGNTSKDTAKTKIKNYPSPNEEYDQHKIDSIKQNKIKPKSKRENRND